MKKAMLVMLAGAVSFVMANEQLARQKGCFACHDVNTKKVGPAFKDIAKKYAGKPDAEAHLVTKIQKGGAGVWGSVPMPPQNVTDQEAKQLVKWILSLK
ncbi:cytochrome c class I [Thermocrinis albus DSM 14484]|uniref:Cytochrome c class I n=1 Tax=Thermocrinis albus (strain DSM 14484 / JCM 11386 / HI 11/12) TaxID=638303 RepID=D3SMI2_THEAH|nr:c-type cytochrome [Thermocrinis albus]ADC89962.1 cytochrome c class I [Thermocrinis albus DSM 14484]